VPLFYLALLIFRVVTKWLASKLDPSTYGNQQKDAQELDIGKMHLDAIRKLGSGLV